MRKLLSCLVSFSLVVFVAANALARTIFLAPGAHASGLGGAFVAIADDATAIYWNPAGLAKQDSSAMISATNISANATSSVAPVYASTQLKTNAFLPFIAGTYKTKSDITVAAGFYAAGGGAGAFSDLNNFNVNAQQNFTVYNVSAAKEVCKGVRVGLGVDMVNMVNLADQNNVPVPGVGVVGEIKDQANGNGYQLNGGVLYDFTDKLTGGLCIKSGTTINLNWNHSTTVSAPLNYSKNYSYPLNCSLGAAYKLIEKLMLAAAIERTNYSGTQNVNTGDNWKDMTQYHIGGEYQLNDKWAVNLGFQNDPSELSPNNPMPLLDTYQYSLYSYVVGATYKNGNWKAAVSLAYSYSDSLIINGCSYQYNLWPMRADVGYRF